MTREDAVWLAEHFRFLPVDDERAESIIGAVVYTKREHGAVAAFLREWADALELEGKV